MLDEEREMLEREGWVIECESPLELRKRENGSFASGEAALIVVAALRQEEQDENDEAILCTPEGRAAMRRIIEKLREL